MYIKLKIFWKEISIKIIKINKTIFWISQMKYNKIVILMNKTFKNYCLK